MLMPLLSESDPKESAEGSIDPLGIYPIADVLASSMVPGVRERQGHPRFLTIIAASLSLCSEFDEDEVACDDISEPLQVFEWYVVEGLARATKDSSLLVGLPGRDKADRALADKVPLSRKRYLKGPRTFGFHGIYRVLAREIGVEAAGRLGDAGFAILDAWQKEQGLVGFVGSADGPGRSHRQRLIDGIRDGLKSGATNRKSWGDFFAKHFGIYDAKPMEAAEIRRSLVSDSPSSTAADFRGEVFEALTSTQGQAVWSKQVESKEFSERRFHEWLLTRASAPLQELLTAIGAYECFCRLLQSAFDDCLRYLTLHKQRIKCAELAELEGVVLAAKKLPDSYSKAIEVLAPIGLVDRFNNACSCFAQKSQPSDWVEQLLDFHTQVQRDKSRAGKAPWFDRFDDGSYLIRQGYIREYQPRYDDHYVHSYRTNSLWSFACDLTIVDGE